VRKYQKMRKYMNFISMKTRKDLETDFMFLKKEEEKIETRKKTLKNNSVTKAEIYDEMPY
jgi:hypothetical protein